MKLLYVLLIVVLVACKGENKQTENEVQLSEGEEKRILKEEIDDVTIEADVAISRNQTKRFLDYEKAGQIGLKEIYQHEEPYSIVFLDGNNFITFQMATFKNSEILSNLYLFIDEVNLPQKIKKFSVNGFQINYAAYEYINRKWVHAVIDIDRTDQKIMMQISSEQIIDAEELMGKYFIVKKVRK